MRNNSAHTTKQLAELIGVKDIVVEGRYFCALLEDGTVRPFTEEEYVKLEVACYDQDGNKLTHEQYAAYYVALKAEDDDIVKANSVE